MFLFASVIRFIFPGTYCCFLLGAFSWAWTDFPCFKAA
jgi:hypothetical protein